MTISGDERWFFGQDFGGGFGHGFVEVQEVHGRAGWGSSALFPILGRSYGKEPTVLPGTPIITLDVIDAVRYY